MRYQCEMADVVFDLCVVGAGIIGSAAARHASRRSGVQVCLIGPDEPKTKTMARDIYGAHYDEGRIARTCHYDPIWAQLAGSSIQRYRDLEQESGIKFFTESGNLIAGTDKSSFIRDVNQVARDLNLNYKFLNEEEVSQSFPYLRFRPGTEFIFQQQNSGHISPRLMVQAQKTVARKHGCTVMEDVVSRISRCVGSNGSYVMIVETETGKMIQSKSVLVATGAFTAFRNLLPRLQLDLELDPTAVALVEISQSVAEQLRGMPCVRFEGEGHKDWFTDEETAPDGVHAYYMLPPILYPNGRYYIKLGLYHATQKPFSTLEEVKQWYVNGNQEIAEKTKKLLLSLFKDLQIKSWKSDFCVIAVTPTTLPYVDKVHAQLGVAVGGNGLGAMSGDEIGRLAANMIFDQWTSEIPHDLFKVKYKPQKASL